MAGGCFALAVALLAFAIRRRAVPAALGLATVAIAWAPTSNFLFATGIVLAERTLYLSSTGLALVLGVAGERLAATGRRALTFALLAGFLAAYVPRVLTRAGVWRGSREVVVRTLAEHPESYAAHLAAARVFAKLGDTASAVRQYGLAVELYPLDPAAWVEAGSVALSGRHHAAAVRFLEQAVAQAPDSLGLQRMLAEARRRRALELRGRPR